MSELGGNTGCQRSVPPANEMSKKLEQKSPKTSLMHQITKKAAGTDDIYVETLKVIVVEYENLKFFTSFFTASSS